MNNFNKFNEAFFAKEVKMFKGDLSLPALALAGLLAAASVAAALAAAGATVSPGAGGGTVITVSAGADMSTVQGIVAEAILVGGANSGISGCAGGAAAVLTGGISIFIFCHLAKEVYGYTSNDWIKFRTWLFTSAPKIIFDLYKEYSKSLAYFISNKPILKRGLKKLFNLAII